MFILGTWYLYLRVLRLCMGEVCHKVLVTHVIILRLNLKCALFEGFRLGIAFSNWTGGACSWKSWGENQRPKFVRAERPDVSNQNAKTWKFERLHQRNQLKKNMRIKRELLHHTTTTALGHRKIIISFFFFCQKDVFDEQCHNRESSENHRKIWIYCRQGPLPTQSRKRGVLRCS